MSDLRIDAHRLESLAADPHSTGAREIAREFEAVLVAEVWKRAVSRPLAKSNPLSGGSAERMYREMLVSEVVERSIATQGSPISEAIAKQLQPDETEGNGG